MAQHRRMLYSALLAVGTLIAMGIAPLSASAYSFGNVNQGPQTGWMVNWVIVTGPANIPAELGGPLQLQGMVSMGSCQLTGMVPGANAGLSGTCNVYGSLRATGFGTSTCRDSFSLGASPEVPAAWVAMPTSQSELPMFYGVTTVHGHAVNDFRVSSSNLLQPQGTNTGLCTSFLFEGYSADLFVPASAGFYDFSGTSGAFGTFLVYIAIVTPTYN